MKFPFAAAGLCSAIGWSSSAHAEPKLPGINGEDDRREVFEVEPALHTWIERSMVALVARENIVPTGNGVQVTAPSWSEQANLCPGERFGDQPAAAFCSGVLVDTDLVLTAGHCLRAFSLHEFAVVFGYYYEGERELATRPEDVLEPMEIVAEAFGSSDAGARIEYGFIRLRSAAPNPRRPAAIRLREPEVKERILSIGAGGGIPIKADHGALVRDVRSPVFDYFIADTDTLRGSSGGVALDGALNVLGVLSRGGRDYEATEENCERVVREPDASIAEEEFTRAARALEGLCAAEPENSMCRSNCGDPCAAAPPLVTTQCSVSIGRGEPDLLLGGLSLTLAGLARRRRRRWALYHPKPEIARSRAATQEDGELGTFARAVSNGLRPD